VGAPKCGTTSLANWLGRHTQVQLAQSKEPGFYRSGQRRWIIDAHHPEQFSDMDAQGYMFDPDKYELQFSGATSDVWRLDASTDYFSDRGCSERIRDLSSSDAIKVMCILRDPVERMYSEYCHTLRDNLEVLSFRDSLDAEKERMAKGYQPLFFHSDRSRYWTHITRWREAFGADNFLTLSYAEIRDTAALEAKILDFMGLREEQIGDMPTLNASGPEAQNSSFLKSLKERLKTPLGLRKTQPSVVYPTFMPEDQHYAFSLIRNEVKSCVADPKISTVEWKTCNKILAES